LTLRVVSLVPSVTETLLDWDVDVIACTRFCEQPALTHVGGTKDPDVAAIVALQPDLVVLDREENRLEDARALIAAGLRVHVTHVRSLSDVPEMEAALAEIVGAARTVAGIESAGTVATPWITAFVPIWRRPWMTINAGTYGSSVLAHLGVENVFADHVDAYPVVEIADVVARRPGLVLLPSEPYRFGARHATELTRWLPAVPIMEIDGRDLFWWGARTPAALVRLTEVLRAVPPPR
jgi:ABC-type Fe3+-hydroxamate transport system substrate-binding protein